MNLNPKTPQGRASQAAILLYAARLSPELLDLPAFTELFRDDSRRTSMELARKIAENRDLGRAILSSGLKDKVGDLWLRAAKAASDNTPMLFPELEDEAKSA